MAPSSTQWCFLLSIAATSLSALYILCRRSNCTHRDNDGRDPDPVPLPYFAPDIPGPLPTRSEIESGKVMSDNRQFRVVEVNENFVVKYGGAKRLVLEGESMLFVQKHVPCVRLPRVYALYSDSETMENYIVMENITGSKLSDVWSTLSHEDKEDVTRTLKGYMDALRRVPSPGYFGGLCRREIPEDLFLTSGIPNGKASAVFDSEIALVEAIVQKYMTDSPSFKPARAEFYRQTLRRVFAGHNATFSHGDLQMKNIIIQKNREGAYAVVLIDWEAAGWYPSFWEYAYALFACSNTGWTYDWGNWIAEGKVVQPFDAEAAMFQLLYLDMWL